MNGSFRRISSLALLASVAALPACVQPRVQQSTADASVTPETLSALRKELEVHRRYSARMEEIYAAQEAEILALRDQVASLLNVRE